MFAVVWIALSLVLILIWLKSRLESRKANPNGLPLPPGPRALPLIHNLLDIPTSYQWLTYSRWAHQYGLCFAFHGVTYNW